MPNVRKIVRFYEPIQLDQADRTVAITGSFWGLLSTRVNGLQPAGRQLRHSGTRYAGEARLAVTPAVQYIYVGRLRPAADNPDLYHEGVGITGPLTTPSVDDLLSEPTYMVPFGTQNYVAVMSPKTGGTRVGALDAWLTAMCGLTTTGDRIELRPLVDPALLAKLDEADGASRLNVRVQPGAHPPRGGGIVGEAIRQATSPTTEEMSLELTWSFGNTRGSEGWRGQLLAAAQWVARGDWADKAEVTLQLPDGATLRTEQHNLLRDAVTLSTSFEVPEGQVPSEQSVLEAIHNAITEFRRRM